MTAPYHQRTPRPQPREWRTQCTEGSLRLREEQDYTESQHVHDPQRVPAPFLRGLQIPVPKSLCSLLFGFLRKDLTMGQAPTIIHFQVTHGPQQGFWAQKGDSPPSGVGHCCLLTLSSTGNLWAGKQSSSPDSCLTHCGTLGKSLFSPQYKQELADIGGLWIEPLQMPRAV